MTTNGLTIKNGVLEKCETDLCGELVIPDGVVSIAENAFERCYGLTSVIIPDSVTNIGANAFSGSDAWVFWGNDPQITKIGDFAFA